MIHDLTDLSWGKLIVKITVLENSAHLQPRGRIFRRKPHQSDDPLIGTDDIQNRLERGCFSSAIFSD